MNKLLEIFRAWKISYNPTADQADLAARRIVICDRCDYKRLSPYVHCSECMCPLGEKMYSPVLEFAPGMENQSCPKGYWASVEKQWSLLHSKEIYDKLRNK